MSDKNVSDYVSLPECVIDKYHRGIIARANYSDLIRLALLIQYGGTWIDATILCTTKEIPTYMLTSDLFLFQTTSLESVSCITRIENYFISARQNNIILRFCQQLLYEYYRKYDVVLEYWLFYDVFQIAIETLPEQWEKVTHYPRASILALSEIMFQPYNEEKFNELIQRYPFHKLSYKVTYEQNSVLDFIIRNFEKYDKCNK